MTKRREVLKDKFPHSVFVVLATPVIFAVTFPLAAPSQGMNSKVTSSDFTRDHGHYKSDAKLSDEESKLINEELKLRDEEEKRRDAAAKLREQESKRREEAAKLRQEEHITKAAARLDESRKKKNENPVECINALLQLSFAYRSANENVKADEFSNEALKLFTTLPAKSSSGLSTVEVRLLWQSLSYVAPVDLESKFVALVKTSELYDPKDSDRELLDGLNYSFRRTGVGDQKLLLKKALEIKASIRGANDRSLCLITYRYANACEAAGDLAEAEKLFLRADKLNPDRSNDSRAHSQLGLAIFYLRHDMDAKAERAINKALSLSAGNVSGNLAGGYAGLVSTLKRRDRTALLDKTLDSLLATGSDALIAALNRPVDEMVNGYITAGALPKAENLLRKRIESGEKCSNDLRANDYRLKLSEVLAGLGNDVESQKLHK